MDPRDAGSTSADRAPSNPVLLVHGILGNRHLYWNIVRRRLIRDGFRVHEVTLPYGMLGDMRLAARHLRDKVEACLIGDEASHMDLVCHSAGGLVARYYLKYLGGDRVVDHMVTLGTPHLGTYFSHLFTLPAMSIARQTRPGSHFLHEINGPGAVSGRVRYTNFWTPLDGIVIPHHNAVLPGAHNIKVPFATHWSLLWSRAIYEQVREALLEGGLQERLATGPDRVDLAKSARGEAAEAA
ncbi:MAG: esterase/lipase family protein [Thermoplasmatota archaeon]